jgi:hypothetical protein
MTGQKTRQARLFFVDNLRIVLIIMVLLWHLAITYGASGFWPYQEVRRPDDLTSLVFTLFSAVNGPYALGFFFLIAGYFTPRSYDRKRPGPFFRDRLLRLGIPMLIYIFVFDPLIQYAVNINVWGFNRAFWAIWGFNGAFWQHVGRHFGDYSGLATFFSVFFTPWGMPFFFTMAGMTSWFPLRRRTAGRYVRERVTRLLIPFIIGAILLTPILAHYELTHRGWWKGGSIVEFILSTKARTYFTERLSIAIRPEIFNRVGVHLWFVGFLFARCITRRSRNERTYSLAKILGIWAAAAVSS